MTIQVHHKLPVTVEVNEVTLPYYWTSGNYVKSFCCLTEDLTLIDMHMNGTYTTIDTTKLDDKEHAAERLEREFCTKNFAEIAEAVFLHKFAEVHRELFYAVNPKLKPHE
jgi:hypothetical protein